jgi:hypothetical protein
MNNKWGEIRSLKTNSIFWVIMIAVFLTIVPSVSILFCEEPPSPSSAGPSGLESIKPEFSPFFKLLADEDPNIKYRMTSKILFFGANIVKHLSSHFSEDFILGNQTTTISSPYEGGPVSEGPKMRILQGKEIDSFLSSKYFPYLAKLCASGSVHVATKKEIKILHENFFFFADKDGDTIVVENGDVSIAYVFENGYLSCIDLIPAKSSSARKVHGLTCSPEVRKMSYADNRLFRDMLNAISGVGFFDEVLFPNAKERKVIKIQAIVPYDNRKTGVEYWTVQHDGQDSCSYIVNFIPDGRGGTTFTVKKDEGTVKP